MNFQNTTKAAAWPRYAKRGRASQVDEDDRILVTNNGINLLPGLPPKSSPALHYIEDSGHWDWVTVSLETSFLYIYNWAEWKIHLKLIYRETHLNLFLIRIKIQLFVISFASPLLRPLCMPSSLMATFVILSPSIPSAAAA